MWWLPFQPVVGADEALQFPEPRVGLRLGGSYRSTAEAGASLVAAVLCWMGGVLASSPLPQFGSLSTHEINFFHNSPRLRGYSSFP